MTITADSPQAAPVRAAGTRGARPVPPAAAPPRPRRQIALTPMRQDTAKSIRKLAAHVQGSHPDMSVHQHLRDAAKVLEKGNEEGAQRHLRAAMFALTPQSLLRNGVHDDAGHLSAREAMHGVHRHLLLVKDITDAGEKNRAAIARDSYGDLQSAPSLPSSPVHADPDAGYGPGALAQKPTARQPGGDRALNAPDRTNSGGSDPAVADPVGPQPKGSKQFSYSWDDLAFVVELSARTAQLEVTPAPRGKPGGPGLYDVKGLSHVPYFQQVVKALIEKRGMPPGKAYAIAYGALRKWRAGGGHTHPEVRAAATGALAGEKAKGAMAKAIHGHATTWDDIGGRIDLAAAAAVPGQQIAAGQPATAAKQPPSPAKSANATAQPRVGAGSPAGGQFAPAGSGGSSSKPMDAHQKHVAHLQHLAAHGTPAQQQAAKALLARMAAKPTPAAPKATASKTARAKATPPKATGTKAKLTVHQAHLAHVTHLEHIAAHGNPAQQKAAAAVLARLGAKP